MDNLNPHPQYKQTGFIVLWAVSVVLSIVLYAGKISDSVKNAGNACTTTGSWHALYALVQPSNWFGLFTIALTILMLQQAYNVARSQWNMLENYRTLALVTLGAIILLIFAQGCK